MRVHRTIYVTDLTFRFKNDEGVTWEELLETAYESRNEKRFINHSNYRGFSKRLSSFYLNETLYNNVYDSADKMHMSFTRYVTLLLHEYVSQIVSQNVSRETYEPGVQHGKK